MAKRATATIGSVGDFLKAAREVHQGWARGSDDGAEIWYRGQHQTSHRLLPGLYREELLHEWEVTFFTRFRALAPAFLDREPRGMWDWYFHMQHYGLPTRLLDWSESALVALFFAIEGPIKEAKLHERCENRKATRFTPCVWMIDAGSLNHVTLGEDLIVDPLGPRGSKISKAWLPSVCVRGRPIAVKEPAPPGGGRRPAKASANANARDNALPIAILPRRASRRIIAQSGTFTVHGCHADPIEEVFEGAAAGHRRIARIDVSTSKIEDIADELRELQYHRMAIYPELAVPGEHVRSLASRARSLPM